MQKTEVVQELYTAVTKDNPSSFGGKKLPVDSVSWYDAVKFCNKVSEIQGRTPCYSVNGETDTDKWNNYSPSDVIWNKEADGWRLPTEEEWLVAADDGYEYSGSDNIDEVAWHEGNSGENHK